MFEGGGKEKENAVFPKKGNGMRHGKVRQSSKPQTPLCWRKKRGGGGGNSDGGEEEAPGQLVAAVEETAHRKLVSL